MSPRPRSKGELNGFLDEGTQIVDGELRFEDTFRVDGRLVGRVASKGDLIVGEGSTVEGQIRVGRLFVSGIVRGTVRAERVEIAPGARVEADVETPALLIEEGGQFQGNCIMEIQPVSESRGEKEHLRPVAGGSHKRGRQSEGGEPGRRQKTPLSALSHRGRER